MQLYKIFLKKIRWPLCCLIFFINSCGRQNDYKNLIVTKADSTANLAKLKINLEQLIAAARLIQTGDVVTRTGNDFTSECLRTLNRRNTTYSHCGIASIEHDSVFVYHALGGEWNPDQALKRDLLSVFAYPGNNRGIGIYSFYFKTGEQMKIASVIKKYYSARLKFDMSFDLKTDDRMYCAEFVYKSLSQVLVHPEKFHHSFIKDV